MKGHSIPGIKGFKGTSLEDGRAASSAFQMKESPLHKEELGKEMDWSSKKTTTTTSPSWKEKMQQKGEKGWSYAARMAQLAYQRYKDKKEKEENPSKSHKETTEKYDKDIKEGTDEVTTSETNEENVEENVDDSEVEVEDTDEEGLGLEESDMSDEDLISQAGIGDDTQIGSAAFVELKKRYPDMSLEQLQKMVEKGYLPRTRQRT